MGSDAGGGEPISCPEPAGGSAPTLQKCGTTVYGNEERLSETPRSVPNFELLALHGTDSFTAPTCLYGRLERDVQYLRNRFDEGDWNSFANVEFDAPDDGRRIFLQVKEGTADAIEAGTYEEWDCLNAHYEKKRHEVKNIGSGPYVELEFEGTYDVRRVMESYQGLRGLRGDGVKHPGYYRRYSRRSDICLKIAGDTYHYVLIRRWGDCPSGCIHKGARYYTTTADGEVCKRGEYNSEADEAARPDWLEICEREESF